VEIMDSHVKDFFRQASDGTDSGTFHRVIALHEAPDIDWKTVEAQFPGLPRGWFELAHVNQADRIEFSRDYWIAKLPFRPQLEEILRHFFSALDDIGIFLTQKKFDDPFEAHLVYSIKKNGGYFCGAAPASDDAIVAMQNGFTTTIFPLDYITFLQIHNGFHKSTDTGISPSHQMKGRFDDFQNMLNVQDSLETMAGDQVNPKSLIPFYESFGMPFYQCFWTDWYPENEMGNVYYSGLTKRISDVKWTGPTTENYVENMAFPTFSDWLMFYLEILE